MTLAAGGRLLFLVNPGAGNGRTEARLRLLLSRAPALMARARVARAGTPGEASAALRGLGPGDLPVAAGGDGTLAFVAGALREVGRADTPLGIMPLGTGNLVARELGLLDARRALQALAGGRVRRIDVMRTSHPAAPLALASISLGFEGRWLRRYADARSVGRLAAGLGALPAVWQRGSPATLECDGESLLAPAETCFSAGLYNTRCYAGGLVMSPLTELADGSAESAVYLSARAYCAALVRGLLGRAQASTQDVRRRRFQSARLNSQGPMQFDGEPAAGGEVSVWLEAAALPVIAPGG